MLLTLNVNEKIMKKATEKGYLIALDIAEKLVQQGIPFRTTHKIAGQLVQTAYKSQKSLNKLTSNEIKQSLNDTKIKSKIIEEIIKSATIHSSLKDRISQGSSGFVEQKRMIEDRKKKINIYRTKTTKQDNEVSNALEILSSKVKELVE